MQISADHWNKMYSINNFLNSITMYRLVLYGLSALSLFALVLSIFGILNFTPYALALSAAILIISCYASNYIFAKLFSAPINSESSVITALILFLILDPVASAGDIYVLALAGVAAMASKYVIALWRRHIFNPAAFGAFTIYIFGLSGATWWVGGKFMFPAVLVLGLLVVRKIRRFDLFLSFLTASLASIFYFSGIFAEALVSWPIIFFGTIMLTEPLTTPPQKRLRIIYGVLVGLLFGAQFKIGSFVPTPEFILLSGNLFSYAVSFKERLVLSLKEKTEIAKDVFEFVFNPDNKVSFAPGQYLEWTLPHPNADRRGVRRYFTITSSPTEDVFKLGVKLNKPSSSFKEKLFSMQTGDKIIAGGLAGDFLTPRDKSKKLVFMAGGIGITPFRSMIKYLIDSGEKRDITLLYAVKEEREIAYRYLFIEAEAKIGLRTEYVVSKFIDAELINAKVPDWKERIFYISGPDAMVRAYKKMLIKMNVPRRKIVTDYFPGFA